MNYPEILLLNLVKSSKKEGIFPVIPTLLISGVNPNIVDPDLGDISLLMIAIAVGNSELIELLIKSGADINYEYKVLSRCMLDNFTAAFDLILATPALARESIEFAFFSSLLNAQRLAYTEKLLKKYREICWNARASDGRSAMEFVSRNRNIGALTLLEKTFITFLD